MLRLVKGSGESYPENAVVVHVRRQMGRTIADVLVPAAQGGEPSIAGMPKPVPQALAEAKEVAARSAISEVIVIVEDDTLWRKDWIAMA